MLLVLSHILNFMQTVEIPVETNPKISPQGAFPNTLIKNVILTESDAIRASKISCLENIN